MKDSSSTLDVHRRSAASRYSADIRGVPVVRQTDRHFVSHTTSDIQSNTSLSNRSIQLQELEQHSNNTSARARAATL